MKNAKADAKPVKLFDGGGMYLYVKRNGSKYWRIDFRVSGKYKTLGLGIYPEVSLANARARREQTRQLITQVK